MNIKLIWTDSLYFFFNNLPQIASLCLPWLIAGVMIEYLTVVSQAEPANQFLFLMVKVLQLAMLPIYNAGLILLMAKQAQNQHPGNTELIKGALKVWVPFFILHMLGVPLLAIGGFIALSLVAQIGFIFLGATAGVVFGYLIMVPLSVWFLAKIAFTKIMIVLDRLQPVEAFQKSLRVTRPYVRLILFCVIPYVVPIMAVLIFSVFTLPKNAQGYAVQALISVAASFLFLFVEVLLFRIYMDAAKNGRADTA